MKNTATVSVVEAEARAEDSRGKNVARRLRRAGSIPGVVYGAKKPALAVSVAWGAPAVSLNVRVSPLFTDTRRNLLSPAGT